MKHTLYFLLGLCGLSIIAVSCNNNSYSAELKEEKALINDYIKRNHINIIYEEPDYMNWGENDFLEIGGKDSYCYFRLTQPGDTTTEEVAYQDDILFRYRQYTLTVDADTLSYWNTNEMAYPSQFQYNVNSSAACTAWHYAVKYLRYTGAEGTLICPSKLGFNSGSYGSRLTPYGYDIQMKIKRF